MARWLWYIRQMTATLWFRATIFGVIGVATALAGYYLRNIIPEELLEKIGADAVNSLLNIISTTMLAVTTFSMSTMVAAYSAATSNVTPRSTRLLLRDQVSQNALATFLGAFIFSLVGIISLKIGLYGGGGRLVLFVVTIAVLALLVVTLIRWIEYLSRLGRVTETINRVEEAAKSAALHRIQNPYLGGVKLEPKNFKVPKGASVITVDKIGYIQFIDMETISSIAEEEGGEVYIQSLPGAFVTPFRPLAYIKGIDAEKCEKRIAQAFVIDGERSFNQDPRFGMIVLSEIASRALSPAVNDPGTAIDVIGTSVRILSLWGDSSVSVDEEYEPKYKRVHVAPLAYQDLFEDVFLPVARDGAGVREVHFSIQKGLAALSQYKDSEFREAAISTAKRAMEHAEKNMPLSQDLKELKALMPAEVNKAELA